MYELIISKLKQYIDKNENDKFKNFIFSNFQNTEVLENEFQNLDLGYVFQKVYLHACLKKNKELAEWLQKECFSQLGHFEQSSIRQCFAYGNFLLKK